MNRLLKAFLISALATASAALVLVWLDDRSPLASGAAARGDDEVDAEGLDPDLRDAMLAELEAQV